jgi:dGTPase
MDDLLPPPDWPRRDEHLAPFGLRTVDGRGRLYPEPDHAYRSPYQRDRDRIVYCTAFRRLMHKTQVVVTQTNDHHRTRLTHTLEVAQIARTLARQLGLNEDLTEAIVLSHDLGHPPFGHAGERALDACLAGQGGFEHNRHGLRIVEVLENPYPGFPGLNLTWEVREAMAQHSRRRHAPEIVPYLQAGQPLLEAQLADAADGLAYDAHDVDDALTVGLISADDLGAVECWRRAEQRARARHPVLGEEHFQQTVIRTLIDWQVDDLLQQTLDNLRAARIHSVDDVRRAPSLLVGFGPEVRALRAGLEEFLQRRVYNHWRVQRMAEKGQRLLSALFAEFCRVPGLLPEHFQRRIGSLSAERVIGDYLAGMTDRYAQDEYLRLFQPYTIV